MNTKVDIKHSFETNNGSLSEKIQWKMIKEYLDEFGITLFYCGIVTPTLVSQIARKIKALSDTRLKRLYKE